MNQYEKLAKDNLDKLFSNFPLDLADRMGAEKKDVGEYTSKRIIQLIAT